MPLDPSIILGVKPAQIESPANQLAKMLQIQEMQQMNQVRDSQMQDAQTARQTQNRLQSLLSQHGNAQDLPDRLMQGGFIDQANTVRKNRTESQNAKTTSDKSQLELATKRLEIMGQTFGHVRQNPTPENAQAAIQFLAQQGILTPEQAQQSWAQVQADPSKVAQLADMAFRSVLSAQQQLPKIEVRDMGGTVNTLQIDPVTGKQKTTATIAKTQSPDSVATDRRDGAKEKAPAGYRFTASGDLEAIPGGPAATKQGGAEAKTNDANDVLSILDEAGKIIDGSTGSYIGTAMDEAARAVGVSTSGAQASAKLKALQGSLVSKMPKMSGPQSDKDVQLYREMAGQIGDSTIPVATRKAAMETIRDLNEKYAGKASGAPAKPAQRPALSDIFK